MRPQPVEADRPISELLQKLGAETAALVRREVDLARAEMLATLRKYAVAAAVLGAAALFALGMFGALTALLVIALALVIPLWAGALTVVVLYAVVAVVAALQGSEVFKRAGAPIPERTIRTVKEDVAAVKSAVRRGRQ